MLVQCASNRGIKHTGRLIEKVVYFDFRKKAQGWEDRHSLEGL